MYYQCLFFGLTKITIPVTRKFRHFFYISALLLIKNAPHSAINKGIICRLHKAD